MLDNPQTYKDNFTKPSDLLNVEHKEGLEKKGCQNVPLEPTLFILLTTVI